MITSEQRNNIKESLQSQGLTFKPLLEEMIDHISCDVEDQMSAGSSFDEALQSTLRDIPNDHFKTIQTNIMDTINKRFTISQWLSYSALGLLFGSLIFKILHLQFMGLLLIGSFVLIACSLLTSAVSGINLNREKDGALRVLGVIAGIIILIIGYSFNLLHLPGGGIINLFAVIILIPALLINTLYVCHNATGEGNLLTFLHEKYTPGIERFLLILLLPVSAYKIFGLLIDSPFFYGGLILLVVIFGAGLQLIALSWRNIERDALHRTTLRMIALTVALLCFSLVFLGEMISFEVRVVMITIYSSVSAWLAYKMDQPETIPSLIMACLVPLVFVGWALLRLEIIPAEFSRIVFNIPVLVLLLVGLFFCRKNETMRAYMIISTSSYLFEYLVS